MTNHEHQRPQCQQGQLRQEEQRLRRQQQPQQKCQPQHQVHEDQTRQKQQQRPKPRKLASMTSVTAIANAFHRRVSGSSNKEQAAAAEVPSIGTESSPKMDQRMTPSTFGSVTASSSPTLMVLSARHGNELFRPESELGQGIPQRSTSPSTPLSAPVPVSSSTLTGGVPARHRIDPPKLESEVGPKMIQRQISPSVAVAMDAVTGKLPETVEYRRIVTPVSPNHSQEQHNSQQHKQLPFRSAANLAIRTSLQENQGDQPAERGISDVQQQLEQHGPFWTSGSNDSKPRIPKSKTVGFLPTLTSSGLPLSMDTRREGTIRATTPVTPTASSSRGLPIVVENIHEVCPSASKESKMKHNLPTFTFRYPCLRM